MIPPSTRSACRAAPILGIAVLLAACITREEKDSPRRPPTAGLEAHPAPLVPDDRFARVFEVTNVLPLKVDSPAYIRLWGAARGGMEVRFPAIRFSNMAEGILKSDNVTIETPVGLYPYYAVVRIFRPDEDRYDYRAWVMRSYVSRPASEIEDVKMGDALRAEIEKRLK